MGFEQLRVCAAYPFVNLKVVGTHSGISIGEDGPSQMSIEEIGRDFEQRFVGSAVGWIWGLIHPLVLLVCWWFVFVKVLHQKPEGAATDYYPLYLFAGMLPWLLFSDTVQRSATAMLDQSNLITKRSEE